jgi:hypothetical protein
VQPTPGLSNSRLNCIFESFRGCERRHGGRPASALGASETATRSRAWTVSQIVQDAQYDTREAKDNAAGRVINAVTTRR